MTADNCENCTLCRLNHTYILGCNDIANVVTENTSTLGRAITKLTGKKGPISLSSPVDSPIDTPSSSTMTASIPCEGTDRVLRHITIWGWIWAFPFLLAHGITTGFECPALGILPMTLSLFVGAVHIAGQAKNHRGNVLVDLFSALFHIGILIPGWIFIAEGCSSWRCYRNPGFAMLGTYGTVPMMINFVIHAYFVLREIPRLLKIQRSCPHCNGDLNWGNKGKQTRAMSEYSNDSKESYLPVTMEDAEATSRSTPGSSYNDHDYNQPRPSTDDEAARLV